MLQHIPAFEQIQFATVAASSTLCVIRARRRQCETRKRIGCKRRRASVRWLLRRPCIVAPVPAGFLPLASRRMRNQIAARALRYGGCATFSPIRMMGEQRARGDAWGGFWNALRRTWDGNKIDKIGGYRWFYFIERDRWYERCLDPLNERQLRYVAFDNYDYSWDRKANNSKCIVDASGISRIAKADDWD